MDAVRFNSVNIFKKFFHETSDSVITTSENILLI